MGPAIRESIAFNKVEQDVNIEEHHLRVFFDTEKIQLIIL
jgi:hypothetical protein